jgi:hypothetical protein
MAAVVAEIIGDAHGQNRRVGESPGTAGEIC